VWLPSCRYQTWKAWYQRLFTVRKTKWCRRCILCFMFFQHSYELSILPLPLKYGVSYSTHRDKSLDSSLEQGENMSSLYFGIDVFSHLRLEPPLLWMTTYLWLRPKVSGLKPYEGRQFESHCPGHATRSCALQSCYLLSSFSWKRGRARRHEDRYILNHQQS
jgi:hypothetical protein